MAHPPEANIGPTRPRSSPRFALAATACAMACAAALVLDAAPGASGSVQPPALPDPQPACSAPVHARAARAHEADRLARARIARYPYAASEGIRALELLREAEDCHRLADADDASAAARSRANAWRARLARDYRNRVVRYRRARESGRPGDALPDIAFLLELLARDRSAFTAELRDAALSLEHPHNQENEP